MEITGKMIIGAGTPVGKNAGVRAIDPSSNAELEPEFGTASEADVQQACALAEEAFDTYRETTLEQRATFLESIADGILGLGASLIDRAVLETGLPRARLEGERGRTMNQLRLFAGVVRDGRWLSATLDTALPNRVPPRPDLRMRKIALGPVAVFGASNFPLAFSVAGGDTASALAAGCPVIVKAHNAHLGTSELVAQVIQKAVADCGLPAGVFSMLIGSGIETGHSLVSNPAIKAVGFTGSRQGGVALMRTAAQRHEPIPVYAEMSSINPVFVLPGALENHTAGLAQAYVDSLTLGAGQFCTNPGLLLAIKGEALNSFVAAATKALQEKSAATMLTPGIHAAYTAGLVKLSKIDHVDVIAQGKFDGLGCAAQASLALCDAQTFISTPALQDEIFGPVSLLIACNDIDEMRNIATLLEGQLTVTVHAAAPDYAMAVSLMPLLEKKAGRILFNGFPTGVEVSHAMVHGGPFPATSDSRSTSVGAMAIERFLRPVCYQEIPAELLPASLSDDNSMHLARLVDGALVLPLE